MYSICTHLAMVGEVTSSPEVRPVLEVESTWPGVRGQVEGGGGKVGV